jgi:hypothetical protein
MVTAPTTGTDMTPPARSARDRSRQLAIRVAFGAEVAMLLFLSGCAVVSVVATAATVTVGVVSTAVDVGVGAAKVTGKVIGKGVDAVTGPGSPVPGDTSSPPKPVSN